MVQVAFISTRAEDQSRPPAAGVTPVQQSDSNTVRVVEVHSTGAVGDGVALDTKSIQLAIDQCHRQGGGTVLLSPGKYLSGSIELKDNVTLRLEKGAVLLASTSSTDYRNVDAFEDATGAARGYCFIGAVDATRVGIEGDGTIDGRGQLLEGGIKPFLVRWVRCRDVTVKNVNLHSSAAWTMHLFQCRGVLVDSVKIQAHGMWNNDGIDIDSCQTVRVENCDIDTDDDALCLKTTSRQPCRDIQVDKCRLRSNWGAIKFGTESMGDFENIRITNCNILHAGGGGIKLFSVDGAQMRDVVISDIVMNEARVPIFIRLGARLRTFRADDKKQQTGIIKNVVIRNVKAKGSGIGILISGIPGHNIENLTLENISILLPGGGKADAKAVIPENEAAYPEVDMFGNRWPAYGMYARHVSGFIMKELTFSLDKPDSRPAELIQDSATTNQEKGIP